MQKKVAIAIDGSQASKDALNYAAMLYSRVPEMRFVLLHIQPSVSLYLVEEAERKAAARRTLEKITKAHRQAALQTLETLAEHMTAKGVAREHIEHKTQPRITGVADDLINLCQTNGYDAILVGRRGIGRLQEWIAGSVTTNLVEHSQITPLWIVDGKISADRILLAADGSQGALRALDHVCFMLSDSSPLLLDIIHVQPLFSDYCSIDINQEVSESAQEFILSGDRHCMDDFFIQAQALMQKYGIAKNSVRFFTETKQVSTANTILKALQNGTHGTVVLGRRGNSRSLFTGSVGRKLLQKISNRAVWIVP